MDRFGSPGFVDIFEGFERVKTELDTENISFRSHANFSAFSVDPVYSRCRGELTIVS